MQPGTPVSSVGPSAPEPDQSSVMPPPSESAEAEAENGANEVKKPSPEQVAQGVLDAHEASVYHAVQRNLTARDIVLPDSFFEATPTELTDVLRTYTEQSERLREGVMQTRKMRESETEKRMSRFSKVMIRILLPDRVSLQGVFTPRTPVRKVIRFVRAALRDARNVKFHLFVVPPKRVLTNLDSTLWQEGLVPAAIVHLGVDIGSSDSGELLKPSLLETVTTAPTKLDSFTPPTVVANESQPLANDSATQASTSSGGKAKSGGSKRIPKWFKTK